VLLTDLGHATYPIQFAKKTMELQKWLDENGLAALEVATKSGVTAKASQQVAATKGSSTSLPVVPPKPYIPVIESISCRYTAKTNAVNPLALGAGEQATPAIRFYHVGPFGVAAVDKAPPGRTRPWLLPQLRAEARGSGTASGSQDMGEFYIGLGQVEPGQAVQLLVQVLEGSGAPLLSKPDDHVTWSFWSGDCWLRFLDSEISDSTRQLTQTGLVSFQIPREATTSVGIMPHGKVWVCAAVRRSVGAVCRILGVFAQACKVTFENHDNASNAMHQVIEPSTVKKLKKSDSTFKKFVQPYSSFGGSPSESEKSFYLNSSERLRHKGRAVTIWDYERLVLSQFPEIHRAKCLHHTKIVDDPDAGRAIHNENAVGHVSVITIPRLAGRNDSARLKPYTHQHTLIAIREFLTKRVSGQLANASAPRVFVCNPLFEEVALEFKLQLDSQHDDFNFYSQRLIAEVTEYLAPWLRSDAAEPQFGGRLFKSALVDFIEERTYVDFITDVVLKHRPAQGAAWGSDQEVVQALTARSVLVPADASSHRVDQYFGARVR
jgi:hypothetical protein